jgi:hypothetical protein
LTVNEAARCRAQRRLEKKSQPTRKAARVNVAGATDKKLLAASNGTDEKVARLLIH